MPYQHPHWSDCATNNEPAYPAGPCDCGAERIIKLFEWLDFKDAYGHPLTMCVDFHNLLKMAGLYPGDEKANAPIGTRSELMEKLNLLGVDRVN